MKKTEEQAPSDEFSSDLLEEDQDDHNDEKEERDSILIARDESRHVWRARLVLVLVLLVVAGAICGGVYAYATHQESELFHTTYYEVAFKVANAFESNAARRLTAIESLATTITSNAISLHQTWPNVVVDDFERRLTYTLDLAAVVGIIFIPFVTGETRRDWEAFSVAHQQWFQEGLALQGDMVDPNEADEWESIATMEKTWGAPAPNSTIPTQIFRISGTGKTQEDGEGPYAPFWQFAPVFPVPNVVNYNAMSHPSRLPKLQALIENAVTLVSEAWDYSDVNDPGTVGKKSALNLFLNRRPDIALNYQDGPVSDLYVPIFEHVNTNDNHNYHKVVGTLTCYVYWQVYFHGILPHGTGSVLAILENTCGQAFSYSITGETAEYIGPGDLHNPKYDHMGVATGWDAFLPFSPEMYNNTQEGDVTFQCHYQVRVYPTTELEEDYITNQPLIFTLLLVFAFVVTSLVFGGYDFLVQKRNRVVMKQAVESTEVVHTLYPAQVRDRMFVDNNNNNNNGNKKKSSESASAALAREDAAVLDEDDGIIADSYDNTTILFADLAGFTAWSDGRPPKHVFRLLESLYSAFDKVAKKRNVFKVETIGDCYLAICGCPQPNENHALVMSRYAVECMVKMEQLIQDELVERLGPTTARLKLRAGLHSGPVTAGVLRGERARFQLFGDTVNTASRIESNGAPGRIQLSEATANLLVVAGKSKWLQEREGGIEAKGKGRLRTFWLLPDSVRSAGALTATATASVVSEDLLDDLLADEHRDEFVRGSESEKFDDEVSI